MTNLSFTTQNLTLDQLKTKLDELRPFPLEGFVRFSDAEAPIYIDSKENALPTLPELPRFLYEAALYLPDHKSISIRQCNDYWLWNQVAWREAPPKSSQQSDDFLVYSQLAIGGRKLKFYTQFLPVTAPGAIFPCLQPAWNAFIGFEE